jgi:cytochrome c5
MENGQNSSSYTQVAGLIIGAILVPAMIVALIAKFSMAPQAPAADTQADTRIKPMASVEVSKESGPHVDKSGEEVVKNVCSACHGTGAMGSPKIGDKAAWGPRIAQGYETLVKHATEGFKMMPARGGNSELSDVEVGGAVAYMANQGGAKFEAPKPADAKK